MIRLEPEGVRELAGVGLRGWGGDGATGGQDVDSRVPSLCLQAVAPGRYMLALPLRACNLRSLF